MARSGGELKGQWNIAASLSLKRAGGGAVNVDVHVSRGKFREVS